MGTAPCGAAGRGVAGATGAGQGVWCDSDGPVVANDTPENKQKNRRVQFVFVKTGAAQPTPEIMEQDPKGKPGKRKGKTAP